MIPETQRPGFKRSALITGLLLAVPALASAVFRGTSAGAFLGPLWKLAVFPHAGIMASGSFPGRPASLLTYPVAVSIAVLQWSLLVFGVAWLSRNKPWRTQLFISAAAVVGLALTVLSLALLSGASIRMD